MTLRSASGVACVYITRNSTQPQQRPPLCEAVDNFLGAAEGFPPHVVVGPQALFPAIHQPRIAQNAQMMRNSGLLQGEAFNNLEDAYFPFVSAE